MTIDKLCKKQQAFADKLFMDFKYTKPGSDEQHRALETFHTLISAWSFYFTSYETSDISSDLVASPVYS
ncbi:MAG: hypothetical protein GKR83_02320 [Synechococcus sp. s2_metabat2_7]|jgi:hypothetical protein|nr:hypothetical protein [Synechococcus sp. s2_metabat2_7]